MNTPDKGYAIKTYNMLVANGIPIEGVSIGSLTDKSTWRIDFTLEATEAQRTQAQALLESFDPDSVPDPE